jgi:CheY-like chemotaxis protein
VRNFLALARHQPPERSEIWVNLIVQETTELLEYDLRTSNVEVVLDLGDDVPPTWADGHQIQQVVVNLVGNAIQAMRPLDTPRQIAITSRLMREPARISLEIADSGPGIPADVQERIFEPFFTTKPLGEGTGLGLSLCRRTLEEHGGIITVQSEVGHGATFRLELPVVGRPAQTSEAPGAQALPPVAGKAILVVDDEVDLAATLAEALQGDGYQVGVADNGATALEMLGRRPYDMILSDTKMPKLDGEHFYAEVERRFPGLRRRIVFVTGDILSREKREFLERTGAPYLTKPFDLREVRQLVHRMLTETGGASDHR